jgi:hypothetical protein
VVQLESRDHANLLIDNGLIFGARLLGCQKYDEKCRLRQCFKCYQYRHTWKQCTEKVQLCGYCAELHNTNDCPKANKTSPEAPKCPACGDVHVSWSASCSKRQEKMARVKLAHMNKTKYHETRCRPPFRKKQFLHRHRDPQGLQCSLLPGGPTQQSVQATQPLPWRSSVTKKTKGRMDPISEHEDRGVPESPSSAPQGTPSSSQETNYGGSDLQIAVVNDENEGWTQAARKSTRKRT